MGDMRVRTPLRDRINVARTTAEPFVSNGRDRYRVTIEHGVGCRSEFVLDLDGALKLFQQIGDAITATSIPTGRISA